MTDTVTHDGLDFDGQNVRTSRCQFVSAVNWKTSISDQHITSVTHPPTREKSIAGILLEDRDRD